MILSSLLLLLGLSCLASPDLLTFDISREVNGEQFRLERVLNSNLESHRYIPRHGARVTRVVEGECVIWDSNSGTDKCAAVTAHLLDHSSLFLNIKVLTEGSEDLDLYYEKKDGSWSPVEPRSLPSFHLLNQSSYSLDKSTALDLTSESDLDLFIIESRVENHLEIRTYAPKLGIKVTQVREGSSVIWEDTPSTHLFQSTVSYTGRTPVLIKLVIETESAPRELFFESRNCKWESVTDNEYREASRQCKFQLPVHDINELDLTKFKVDRYEVLGVDTAVYTPLLGTNVHKIVEGNEPIWEGTRGKYVDKIWVYSRNERYLSTHLRIIDSDKKTRINNYMRAKGGWKLVLKDEL